MEDEPPKKAKTSKSKKSERSHRFIITGMAGTGKTLFMKWLTLHFLSKTKYGFPILFELRNYNDSDADLLEKIYQSVYEVGRDLSREQFEFGLSGGAFRLVLDGFDEVPWKVQRECEKQIAQISKTFPKVSIIVSSRPDQLRFSGWREFSEFKIADLNFTDIENLVGKLVTDEKGRHAVISELNSGAYKKHAALYANPLLATMMIMVSDHAGRLPENMSALYEKTFDVLVVEHDSIKRLYRELKCDANIHEIRECFRAFCTLTFLDEMYEFTPKVALEYLSLIHI